MPHRPTGTLHVRVPASTSNLGPGFDQLGLALALHLDAVLTPIDAPSHVLRRSGPGALDLPDTNAVNDLVVRAFEHAATRLGVQGIFQFDVTSAIPVARGFGSSGAAVAAGLLLANARATPPASAAQLLAWGAAIEGHPDNVTASLFGGCTLCHPAPTTPNHPSADPVWIANPIHPAIAFAVAWPAQQLDTRTAREALPQSVPFVDAVENARRLPMLLEGLRTGVPHLISIGGQDRLHVAHRLPLIAGAERAIEAADREGGWLATISGAGSGLVALGPHDRIEAIAHALSDALGDADARVLKPVFGTPQVGAASSPPDRA